MIRKLLLCAALLAPETLLSQEYPLYRTEVTHRVGGPHAPPEFAFSGRPGLIVDPRERVYVRAAADASIVVLGPGLEFERRIGRSGEGPGEFTRAVAHGLVGDTLWVRDWPRPRVSLFTPEGDHLVTRDAAFAYPGRYSSPPAITAVLQNGGVFVTPPGVPTGSTERRPMPVLIESRTGTDTIARTIPRGLYIPRVGVWNFNPLPAPPLVAVAPDGSAVTVATWEPGAPDRLELSSVRPDASLRWRRSYEIPAQMVPTAVADSLVAEGERMASGEVEAARRRGVVIPRPLPELVREGLSLSEYYPPARSIFIDIDGRAWLEQSAGLRGGTWIVFDKAGILLHRVVVPQGIDLQQAKGDDLWATTTDDLDVPYVVKLRVMRN